MQSHPRPESLDRLRFLDALRGWAIVLVIANHAATYTQVAGRVGNVAILGAYGVQLFFVISAFTIFLTYSTSRERERFPTANFFTRRLLRIVPVYWVGIVLYASVYGLTGSRGALTGPEPWHYPVHALLLNVWHPLTSSSVVPGGWSISVEVMFYLSMPLWIQWIKTRGQAVVFVVASSVVGVLISLLVAKSGLLTGLGAQDVDLYLHRLPTNQVACFAVGIWLYFAWRDKVHLKFGTTARSAGVLLIALLVFDAARRWRFTLPSDSHLFALSFGLTAFALAAYPWPLAVNAFTTFMGRISYSAYLVHFLVLKQLTIFFPGPSTPIYFLGITVCGFAITVPLAWLGFRYVEQPATLLAKRIIAKRESGMSESVTAV